MKKSHLSLLYSLLASLLWAVFVYIDGFTQNVTLIALLLTPVVFLPSLNFLYRKSGRYPTKFREHFSTSAVLYLLLVALYFSHAAFSSLSEPSVSMLDSLFGYGWYNFFNYIFYYRFVVFGLIVINALYVLWNILFNKQKKRLPWWHFFLIAILFVATLVSAISYEDNFSIRTPFYCDCEHRNLGCDFVLDACSFSQPPPILPV